MKGEGGRVSFGVGLLSALGGGPVSFRAVKGEGGRVSFGVGCCCCLLSFFGGGGVSQLLPFGLPNVSGSVLCQEVCSVRKGFCQEGILSGRNFVKGARSRFPGCRRPKTPTCCPKKKLEQGSSGGEQGGRAPFFLLVFRPLGLPGFHLVQPGLEALAHPLQHAGEESSRE